jgi:hypothetical protein
LGQKLPRRRQIWMSALPQKAATALADRRVRFGPIGDMVMLGPGLVDSSQTGAPIAGVTHLVLDAE